MPTISFFAHGTPSPGGSKKFVGFNKKTKRALIVDMGGKKTKTWRKVVEAEAKRAFTGTPPLEGPLEVSMEFTVARPQAHFDAKGFVRVRFMNVKPITRPDLLKLSRSTEDALTGIAWLDDSQTFKLNLSRRYANEAENTGVLIVISTINPTQTTT